MIYAIVVLALLLLAAIACIIVLNGKRAALQATLQAAHQSDLQLQTLAEQLVRDSRRQLTSETAQQMDLLLDPLRHQLDAFSRVIDDKYSREAAERHALRQKIDELRDINTALGSETRRLADALRGNNRVQGQWGELVLRSLLENAGLSEGREFTVQKVMEGEEGQLRPDVVVRFPAKGCVIIDSKASMTAYMNYVEAEDSDRRQAAARAHVASVRRHVDELARKSYHELLQPGQSPEFVLMFMPNEGAYIAAMQLEPNLWQEAYNKRIIIISPTHLLSVLRMVEQMWRHDAQNRNAMEIASEAGKMYDKFAAFVADLRELQRHIVKANESYDTAMRKLTEGPGNLMTRAEKLRALGAKSK